MLIVQKSQFITGASSFKKAGNTDFFDKSSPSVGDENLKICPHTRTEMNRYFRWERALLLSTHTDVSILGFKVQFYIL